MPLTKESAAAIVLVVDRRITREDIPDLCAEVCRLLDDMPAGVVTCDVGTLTDPDAVALDALAQLQLAARRRHQSIRLRSVGVQLRDLLMLAGLEVVLPSGAPSPVERIGQTEDREEFRVKEAVDRGDPPV